MPLIAFLNKTGHLESVLNDIIIIIWTCISLFSYTGHFTVLSICSHNREVYFCINIIILFNPCSFTNNPQYIANVATTIYTLFGLIFFDLLYVAVMINYISQCQLLHYFVINVTEKVRHKAYGLGDAIKVC